MHPLAMTLLTEAKAACFLGVSQESLQYRRRRQLPPNFITRNGRIYYTFEELQIPLIPLAVNNRVIFSDLKAKIRELSRLQFESFSLP